MSRKSTFSEEGSTADHPPSNLARPIGTKLTSKEIDVGLRQPAERLKLHAFGLILTGIVAYGAAESGLYASLATTPVLLDVVPAPLALVLFLGYRIDKMSLGCGKGGLLALFSQARSFWQSLSTPQSPSSNV